MKYRAVIVLVIIFSFFISLCFHAIDEETLNSIEGNYNKLILFFANSFMRIDYDQKIDRWRSTDDGISYNDAFYLYSLKADRRSDGVDKDYTDYESIKNYYLSIATPSVVMQMFASPQIINVNGLLYMTDMMGGTGEIGGLNQWEVIQETDDYLKVKGSLYTTDGINLGYETDVFLLASETYELKKIDGIWKIARCDDYSVSPVFLKYINNIIKGYVFTENTNFEYRKFNDLLDSDGRLDDIRIIQTDYSAKKCTGSAYAFLTEYDKNGEELALHKITVEIGENLSEKITDTVVESYGGYDPESNPLTVDGNILFFAAAAAVSLSALLPLTRAHRKDY